MPCCCGAQVIKRNSVVPAQREVALHATEDNQPVAQVSVYEGCARSCHWPYHAAAPCPIHVSCMTTCVGDSNHTMADANRLVASLVLPLAPGPCSEPRIHVQARVLRWQAG